MRHWACLALTLSLLTACDKDSELGIIDAGLPPDRLRQFRLRVVKSSLAQFDDDDARMRLNEASQILARSSSNGDVACCISLSLLNDRVDRDNGLTNRVDSSTVATEVKMRVGNDYAYVVVPQLGNCNPMSVGTESITEGCTVDGMLPMLVRPNSSSNAWAHEFGHFQRLAHVNCREEDNAYNLMAGNCPQLPNEAVANFTRISDGECTSIRTLREDDDGINSGAVDQMCNP